MKELDLPDSPDFIEAMLAFKTIHVLNDLIKDPEKPTGFRHKATHVCMVLFGGPQPLWGVWTIRGKFVRYAGSRDQIIDDYPSKSWTTTMASWSLRSGQGFKDREKRRSMIQQLVGHKIKELS